MENYERMVTVIKPGTAKRKMESLLKKLREGTGKKGIDAKKYCGTVKFKEDGLVLQKRWRDEWE